MTHGQRSQRWNVTTLWASKWRINGCKKDLCGFTLIALLVYFGLRLPTTDFFRGTWSRKTWIMSHMVKLQLNAQENQIWAQAPSNLHNMNTETCRKNLKKYRLAIWSLLPETSWNWHETIHDPWHLEISQTSSPTDPSPQCCPVTSRPSLQTPQKPKTYTCTIILKFPVPSVPNPQSSKNHQTFLDLNLDSWVASKIMASTCCPISRAVSWWVSTPSRPGGGGGSASSVSGGGMAFLRKLLDPQNGHGSWQNWQTYANTRRVFWSFFFGWSKTEKGFLVGFLMILFAVPRES